MSGGGERERHHRSYGSSGGSAGAASGTVGTPLVVTQSLNFPREERERMMMSASGIGAGHEDASDPLAATVTGVVGQPYSGAPQDVSRAASLRWRPSSSTHRSATAAVGGAGSGSGASSAVNRRPRGHGRSDSGEVISLSSSVDALSRHPAAGRSVHEPVVEVVYSKQTLTTAIDRSGSGGSGQGSGAGRTPVGAPLLAGHKRTGSGGAQQQRKTHSRYLSESSTDSAGRGGAAVGVPTTTGAQVRTGTPGSAATPPSRQIGVANASFGEEAGGVLRSPRASAGRRVVGPDGRTVELAAAAGPPRTSPEPQTTTQADSRAPTTVLEKVRWYPYRLVTKAVIRRKYLPYAVILCLICLCISAELARQITETQTELEARHQQAFYDLVAAAGAHHNYTTVLIDIRDSVQPSLNGGEGGAQNADQDEIREDEKQALVKRLLKARLHRQRMLSRLCTTLLCADRGSVEKQVLEFYEEAKSLLPTPVWKKKNAQQQQQHHEQEDIRSVVESKPKKRPPEKASADVSREAHTGKAARKEEEESPTTALEFFFPTCRSLGGEEESSSIGPVPPLASSKKAPIEKKVEEDSANFTTTDGDGSPSGKPSIESIGSDHPLQTGSVLPESSTAETVPVAVARHPPQGTQQVRGRGRELLSGSPIAIRNGKKTTRRVVLFNDDEEGPPPPLGGTQNVPPEYPQKGLEGGKQPLHHVDEAHPSGLWVSQGKGASYAYASSLLGSLFPFVPERLYEGLVRLAKYVIFLTLVGLWSRMSP